MYMDLMRSTIVAPKAYIPGATQEIARGKDGTYCKHVYAVYQLLTRVEDVPLSAGFEEDIIHVREPGSVQQALQSLNITGYPDFVKLVQSGEQIPEVTKEIDKILEGQSHRRIDEFHNWLDTKWLKWKGYKAEAHKKMILESIQQSPHLILYILTYEAGHAGTVPDTLLKVGWNLIKSKLVTPVVEKEEAPGRLRWPGAVATSQLVSVVEESPLPR